MMREKLTIDKHNDAASAMRICSSLLNSLFCLIYDHQGLRGSKAMGKISRAGAFLIEGRDLMENDLFNAVPREQRMTADINECYGGPVTSADLDRVRQMLRISNKTESANKDE